MCFLFPSVLSILKNKVPNKLLVNMQFPLIHHQLHHFQAYLISIQKQNPSFFSASIYTLCKWCILVLAFIATVRTITNILIVRFRRNAPSLSSIPLLNDDDFSDIDDEEQDEMTPSSSSDEDSETYDDNDDEDEDRDGAFFRFRASENGDSGFLRCPSIGDLFSLAEIANSKSVVKLWDSIGLGLGFGFDNSDSSDVVSVYDYGDEDRRIRPDSSGKPQTPAMSCASPALVVSAEESSSGNLAVRVWDARLRRRTPAVVAEWGGGDDGRYGLTVGDMRNVRSPLENVTLTESVVDTWWPNFFLLKI